LWSVDLEENSRMVFAWLHNAGERLAEGSLLWAAGATLAISAIAFVLFRILRMSFNGLNRWIASLQGRRIRPVRYRGQDLFTEQEVTLIVLGLLRFVRYAAYLILLYGYLTFVFGLFPATRALAGTLFGYFTTAVLGMLSSTLHYMPSLVFLAVLYWVTRAVVRLMKMGFDRIGTGRVQIASFPPEFAQPTFKIARALVIVFAVMIAYPYLPGSGSPAFRAVSIFLGLLVSLGSSGAIANIVAGLTLTYMRAFHVGDRVRIADAEGDIIDRTTFVTKIRTVKNVEITIPNAMVMSNHIINFTTDSDKHILVLHTTVTLGYDVDWRKVHEAMIGAALETEGIESEPAPFVLQKALDDFYVHYELNAHTRTPHRMAAIYSELHSRLQDALHAAGIEIASPHLSSIRDGNHAQVPDDYLPSDYETPSFRIGPLPLPIGRTSSEG
jgi:small-conductance mechanosensitive channel